MSTNQKSLINLTLLYTAGNLSSKVMSFVLVFFTTFYLSKDEVGEFDLIIITISLLSPFITLQLSDSALRWLLDNKSKENNARIFSTISVILTILLFFFLCGIIIYKLFFPIKYIVLLFLLFVFQSFNLFFQQCIRGFGNNRLYVFAGLINTFVYVIIAVFVLVFLNLKIEGLLIANITALLISSIIIFFNGELFKYWSLNYVSFELGKTLLGYSIPLIPNSVSWWAISSANRYIILLYLGSGSNGIFAIAYKFPTILLMFVNIFYLAWQEKAIVNYESEDRDKYYSSIFEKYVRLLFSISILIIAFNKILLKFIVGKDFFEAWKYTPLLILGIIFSAMAGFYGTGYLSAKKTKGAFKSSVLGGLATVFLSFILIPKFGLYGASIAICLGYLVLLLIRISDLRNIFKIEFPLIIFSKLLIVLIIVTMLSYGGYATILFNMVFSVLIILFFNKDFLNILRIKFMELYKRWIRI